MVSISRFAKRGRHENTTFVFFNVKHRIALANGIFSKHVSEMFAYLQAHLSARTVKAFTAKVVRANGNIDHADNYNMTFDGAEDGHVTSVEHTNDETIGKTRISKSSGRLWRTGLNEKVLSRMSMPAPEVSSEILGSSFRSEIDVRRATHLHNNGYIVTPTDSLEDVNDEMFDDGNKRTRGNSDSLDDSSVSQDEHTLNDDDDVSVYDTYL